MQKSWTITREQMQKRTIGKRRTQIMKRILVRADDLGYCEGVNYGIAKAVKEGDFPCQI